MEQEKLIRFLSSSGLLNHQKATEVAAHFDPVQLLKNDFFLTAGKISDRYLFLEEGIIRAFVYDTEGKDVSTNFYSGNQVVFEVSSFFNRVPAIESFQALTHCSGWAINFERLNMLFHSMPEFREFGRNMLVNGFSSLKQRMLSTITETAEFRYERLLQTRPELFQSVPLKYMASYLGITDTSLSRIRKELTKR